MLKNIKISFRNINEKIYLKRLRRRLKNKDFTIVSNNCIGGVIYHNLGQQFLSPTINLFVSSGDYVDFVKNFKYYSECDIQECVEEKRDYPVGIIVPKDEEHKAIKVFFQHYKTFEEAKRKWIERYSRVNYDNIFYIFEFYDTKYDMNLLYEFDQLQNINKVLITHRKFENLRRSVAVSCYKDDKPIAQILKYKGLSGRRYLEEFDYVSFLNNGM